MTNEMESHKEKAVYYILDTCTRCGRCAQKCQLHPYMAADARLVVKEMTWQTERKQELDEYEKAALDEWESGLGPENKTSQFQSLSFGNICKVYLLQ